MRRDSATTPTALPLKTKLPIEQYLSRSAERHGRAAQPHRGGVRSANRQRQGHQINMAAEPYFASQVIPCNMHMG